MAPRKQKPTNATAVIAEPASEQPAMTCIANPMAVAHATPRTRDEIAIRDAVRKGLADVENAIVAFVADKSTEGFTMAEINELYAVELPIFFGYRVENGRIRASYDGQIVERAG
jgi:phosphosulfolactate phosphohydrolase-like enzyme